MTDPTPEEDPPDIEGPPPLLGTWNNLYAVVLAALAIQIVAFWLITKAYQ